MQNDQPTEEQKSEALEKIMYSMDMLMFTYDFLISRKEGASGNNESNCYLESFLTHTRNLNEFFYPKMSNSKRKNDIRVSLFTDKFTPDEAKSKSCDLISKSLSHLTYYEKDGEKPQWDIHSIAKNQLDNCLEFLSIITLDEYLKLTYEKRIRYLLINVSKRLSAYMDTNSKNDCALTTTAQTLDDPSPKKVSFTALSTTDIIYRQTQRKIK